MVYARRSTRDAESSSSSRLCAGSGLLGRKMCSSVHICACSARALHFTRAFAGQLNSSRRAGPDDMRDVAWGGRVGA